ncbi:glutathione hydrolase 3-like isoform X1 [Cimex lectularius]|uniref:Uncharacterized protein n=2 Tax=Cimex lectularius TaxID=79782 RepID=A0A8I6SGQ3_CIMLE|nr:glutathione hydrolase 3-like isoform X1 [Cimex lectularius]XP_024080967.1 glutathione hydrolase 3-like isoform X1 [Cimex lectularius]XP_024080969.1 glutathione hydrolase 3-like isoform X1 [Cimex lectularius]
MVHIYQGENTGNVSFFKFNNYFINKISSFGQARLVVWWLTTKNAPKWAKILREGGNAVNVAVGVSFCMGVVHPHLTGIGGNGLVLIYDHKLGKLRDCINFNRKGSTSSETVGIPGFINGLSFAHSKFGRLPWKKILSYSIELARTGFIVTESLKSSVQHLKTENIKTKLGLWLNSLKVGKVTTSKPLAETLELLAEQGGNVFYSGAFTKNLAHVLSEDDMKNYKVLNNVCAMEEWNKFKLFTTGQVTGGPLLLKALKNMNNASNPYASIKAINEALTTAENYTHGVVVTSVDKDDNYVCGKQIRISFGLANINTRRVRSQRCCQIRNGENVYE